MRWHAERDFYGETVCLSVASIVSKPLYILSIFPLSGQHSVVFPHCVYEIMGRGLVIQVDLVNLEFRNNFQPVSVVEKV